MIYMSIASFLGAISLLGFLYTLHFTQKKTTTNDRSHNVCSARRHTISVALISICIFSKYGVQKTDRILPMHE
jgi:hypothetical protein